MILLDSLINNSTNEQSGYATIESIVVVFMMVEMMFRVFSKGLKYFFNALSVIELLIVFLSFSFSLTTANYSLRRFSIMRLPRVANYLASNGWFQSESGSSTLSLMIAMFKTAPQVLMSVCLVSILTIFLFAVPLTILLGVNSADQFKNDVFIQDHFGDAFKSMFTLFQIMILDGWTKIVRPIMEKPDGGNISILIFIFIALTVLLLSNLITAVLVQKTFEAQQNSEADMAKIATEKKKRNAEELGKLFIALDADNSG